MSEVKKNAPINATTVNKVCKLNTDNYDTKDYWILLNGTTVTICKQREGQQAEDSFTLPMEDFNKIVRWYIKPQTPNPQST